MPNRNRSVNKALLDALVARRGQVVRTAELKAAGLAESTISYRLRSGGPWQRVLPGVAVLHSGPPTSQERLAAALLYAGGGAMVTGRSALRLYGVRSARANGDVHILVPHKRRRASKDDVVIERSRRLPLHRSVDRIPVSPIARATVDATRRMTDLREVRALVAEVVQRQLCSIAELGEEIKRASVRGSALPRRVLAEVAAGVRSVAEAEARELIRRAGLPHPLWNEDVYDAKGRWLGRPDAFWPDLGLVLEIDSLEWHLSPASYRATQARQRRLAKAGLMVLPVLPSVIRQQPVEFMAELAESMAAAARRTPPVLIIGTSRAS
jgi:hypothetical protein